MPTLERLFPQGLSQDRLLGGRVQLAQPLGGYRVAVDPVLLAAAVPARAGELAADFGAGSGAVGLCLAARVQGCRVVGLEREPDLAALTRANASDMGLSAYAFTNSPARARRAVHRLKAGMVGINSFAMAASEAPFGGTGYSGMGREGGAEGIADYLDVKSSQVVWA